MRGPTHQPKGQKSRIQDAAQPPLNLVFTNLELALDLAVTQIESLDKVAKDGQVLLLGLYLLRRVDASRVHHLFGDIDGHTGAHGQGDAVAGPCVDVDRVPVLRDVEDGVKDVIPQLADQDSSVQTSTSSCMPYFLATWGSLVTRRM